MKKEQHIGEPQGGGTQTGFEGHTLKIRTAVKEDMDWLRQYDRHISEERLEKQIPDGRDGGRGATAGTASVQFFPGKHSHYGHALFCAKFRGKKK